MPRLSAGIVLYRWLDRSKNKRLEVLLVHPGGPFWKNKDAGSWSIPKGEYEPAENALNAARREFAEETGLALPEEDFKPLGELRQPSGKVITAWAYEGDFPAEDLRSNLFSMEWPPKSGKMQQFPEVDRAAWFGLDAAREKLIPGQRGFLDRLLAMA
jgi:predicted NUDIX family NTP pyrophosphohydrolase